jgi:hypothetical protein
MRPAERPWKWIPSPRRSIGISAVSPVIWRSGSARHKGPDDWMTFQEPETEMKKVAVVICAISLMSAAMPALADGDGDAKQDLDIQKEVEKAGESLKNSLTTLMNLVEKVVKGVPQYEAPEILDNGDIIIRRKTPADEETGKPDDHVQT